jgi:hypothetical protein
MVGRICTTGMTIKKLNKMKKQILKVVSVLSMSNAFILLTLGEYGKYSTILFIIGFVCILELVSLKLKEKN